MLKIVFKDYQSITSVKIITDLHTKTSRGYGFIKLTNYQEFQRVMKEMNGRILMSKAIKVNQAGPKKTNGEVINDNDNYIQSESSCNNFKQNFNTNQMNFTIKQNNTKYYNNFNQNNFPNNSLYEFAHHTTNHPQNSTVNFNETHRYYNSNYNYNSGLHNYSNCNSNISTKFQSSDSVKSHSSLSSAVNPNVSNFSSEIKPENFSKSSSIYDKKNAGTLSFQKILDPMENKKKLVSDETPFDILGKYLKLPNLNWNVKKDMSNLLENRKCPLNNFLYYYNFIDIDKDVNFLDQFCISFSKYGHSYECLNGIK
jgi:RNA recognition motif-containing protein